MAVLVGQKAPEFKLEGVVKGEFRTYTLSEFKGKWLVLFFYPLDFTFVCPTEIIEFSNHLEEFKKLGAEVVAASVDSKFSHLAWLNTPRAKGGIEGVQLPLLSDINKTLSRDLGILLEEPGIALRGLFVIDPDGVVQSQIVNNLPVGRSVAETLRLVEAFQHVKKTGEVCPANWTKGQDTISPAPKESLRYFEKAALKK